MKKTYRIKTNNQELLIRKQNESDATSRWIEFQKTRPIEFIKEKLTKEKRNRNKIQIHFDQKLCETNDYKSLH